MKRGFAIAAWLLLSPLLVLRCGGEAGSVQEPDASVADGSNELGSFGGDARGDGAACARRGSRVEGIAPIPVKHQLRALASGRVLYMSVTNGAPGCGAALEIARVALGARADAPDLLCLSDRQSGAEADALSYSETRREIAVGGASQVGPFAKVALVGAQDPGWVTGGSGAGQRVAFGSYPEPDAGDPISRLAASTPVDDGTLFVGGTFAGAVSVLFQRDARGGLAPVARLEPRVTSYDAVDVGPGGTIWAGGVTLGGHAALVKLDRQNRLDPSSVGDGFVELTSDGARSVAIGTDGAGNVWVATNAGGGRSLLLTRMRPDGSLDAAFGAGGSVEIPLLGSDFYRRGAFIVERSGGALIGGLVPNPSGEPAQAGIVRVDATGALDLSFGEDGPYLREPGVAVDVALQPAWVQIVGAAPAECEGEFVAYFVQRGTMSAFLFH